MSLLEGLLNRVDLQNAIEAHLKGEEVTIVIQKRFGAIPLDELRRLQEQEGAVFVTHTAEVKKPAITIMEEGKDVLEEECPPPEDDVRRDAGVKSRKKVDVGKMKALRKAGWSLQKIADEMGRCAQTVANILSREENKDAD